VFHFSFTFSKLSDLKKQRVTDAQVALKERERLAKVAQSLKANNTKNTMLEQELDRV
jgi:flagellar biosynthesis chaperone FliJ